MGSSLLPITGEFRSAAPNASFRNRDARLVARLRRNNVELPVRLKIHQDLENTFEKGNVILI